MESESSLASLKGMCRACRKRMTWEQWWVHQGTHKKEDFPLIRDGKEPPGTRALFAPDAYDLTNDTIVEESK